MQQPLVSRLRQHHAPEQDGEHTEEGGQYRQLGGKGSVAAVPGGENGGGGSGRHAGHEHRDSGGHRIQSQCGTDPPGQPGQQDQPQDAVEDAVPVEDGQKRHIRQDGPHDEHGNGRIAAPDVTDGHVQKSRRPPLGQDQYDPDIHSDQTGMGQDLFQHFLPAFLPGHEISGAHGPHDQPQGNQEHRGITRKCRWPHLPESIFPTR